MSTSAPGPAYPHHHPHEPSMSLADWAEDIAVGLMLFIAAVVLAGILALLIIV